MKSCCSTDKPASTRGRARRALLVGGVIVLAISGTAYARARSDGPHHHHPAATATVYTCPMHPEVVSDKPGVCPKCNMALEPKASTAPRTERE